MKTMLHTMLAGMILVLSSNTALADRTFGPPGCGQWVNEQTVTNKAWLIGFLSGLNTMNTLGNRMDTEALDPLNKLNSAEQAYLWMDSFCKANPLKDVGHGAIELYLELANKK